MDSPEILKNPWIKIGHISEYERTDAMIEAEAGRKGEPFENIERFMAPYDGQTIDIVAKKYDPEANAFRFRRFTDVEFDHETRRFEACSLDLNVWRPVYWMEIPALPHGGIEGA